MTKEMSVGAIERMCSVDKKLRTLQRDMQQVINKYLPIGTKLTVHSMALDKTIYGEVAHLHKPDSVGLKLLQVDSIPYEGEDILWVEVFNRTKFELIKIGE